MASVLSLFIWFFAATGFGAVVFLLGARISDKAADSLMDLATKMKSRGYTLILLRDEDGNFDLQRAEFEPQNRGYWIHNGDSKEFYSAKGKGGQPGRFYKAGLVPAYSGLGSVIDFSAAEIARRARVRFEESRERNPGKIEKHTKKLATDGGQIVNSLHDRVRTSMSDHKEHWRNNLVELEKTLEDNGYSSADVDFETVDVEENGDGLVDMSGELLVELPEKAIVDPRDVMNMAPFDIHPGDMDRVEFNAKASESGLFSHMGAIEGMMILAGVILGFALGYATTGGAGASVGSAIPMALSFVFGVIK